MARLIIVSLAVAAMALPAVMAPSEAAAASCHSRKATGTVVGGLGGALVGNAISKGGGGLIVGGLGGALIGRQVGKSGCHRTRTVYYDSSSRLPAATRPAPVRQVYYDHMGNPVASGEVQNGTFQRVSTAAPSAACRNGTVSYYDERGRLAQRQTCTR